MRKRKPNYASERRQKEFDRERRRAEKQAKRAKSPLLGAWGGVIPPIEAGHHLLEK